MLRFVFLRIYVPKYFCLRIIENQKMCFNVFNFVKHTARLRHIGVVKNAVLLLPFRKIRAIFASRTMFLRHGKLERAAG